MIVVLDTNVIISTLLSSKGPPAEIIRRWEADEFEVVTSAALLTELERALGYQRVRKYYRRPEEIVHALLKRFKAVVTSVDPQFSLDVIEEDPSDNRVLEVAIAGGAAYIVTGDDHLLSLKQYRGVAILNPAGFLTLLEMRRLV